MSTDQLISNEKVTEHAVLISVYIKGTRKEDCETSLSELRDLCKAAIVNVQGTMIIPRISLDKSFLIGKGKLEEIREYCEKEKIKTLIFDEILSPLQNKNLQKHFQFKIIDRVELILQIFARRARSAEAKIQVEMAQLIYLMPRLTHMWAHLSRQFGGVGCKGPGETQLEIDRRRAKEKIFKFKQKLLEIKQDRQTQRKNRLKNELPHVCLVGYTHAGKSTLFNVLTESNDAKIRHELFSTLDPISRKISVSPKKEIILSDTIGFIQKLPHFLIDTFKATLEEVLEADLLLVVMDGSDPEIDEKLAAVNTVLSELNVDESKKLMVINKLDLLSSDQENSLKQKFHPSVCVSARENLNIAILKEDLATLLFQIRPVKKYFVPFADLDYWKKNAMYVHLVSENYVPEGLEVEAEMDSSQLYRFIKFEIG